MDGSCFLCAVAWLPLISDYLFNNIYMMNSLSWKIIFSVFLLNKKQTCSLSTVMMSPSEVKFRQAYVPL